MKVRDEKLGKIIMAMNNEEAHVFLIKQLADITRQHEKDREEDRWIMVGNGEKEKKLTTEVTANTHDAVIEIREDTKILREIQKGLQFMIRFKIFWLIGILVLALFTAMGLDISMNIIKNHIK